MAWGQSEDIFWVKKGFVNEVSNVAFSDANITKEEGYGDMGRGLVIEVGYQWHHQMDGKVLPKDCRIHRLGQSGDVKCLEITINQYTQKRVCKGFILQLSDIYSYEYLITNT